MTIDEQRRSLEDRVKVFLEIGDGWVPLVTRLIDDLDAVGLAYDVDQIKEKFGSLRFYYRISGILIPEESRAAVTQIQELVRKAETESIRICQVCGEPGFNRVFGGWLKTVCDEHIE